MTSINIYKPLALRDDHVEYPYSMEASQTLFDHYNKQSLGCYRVVLGISEIPSLEKYCMTIKIY